MSHLIIKADARKIPLPDRSIHAVVTSPPYYGLRSYLPDDHPRKGDEIGLERTPKRYVDAMVLVFREVWRILRDDGTLWINIGDTFSSAKGASMGIDPRQPNARRFGARPVDGKLQGLKRKDLILIPARLALALQADGWYLRSEIIWSKKNCLPETARDRPGRTHETVYLLSKQPRYYYDDIATRTPQKTAGKRHEGKSGYREGHPSKGGIKVRTLNPLGAAERTVWPISSRPYKESHFATMPPELAAKCIRLGTSENGCCPRCAAPWRRIVERTRYATRPDLASKYSSPEHERASYDRGRHLTEVRSLGWESSCTCLEPVPVPCRVFDPFGGVATTVVVAEALGRHGIMTELSDEYLGLARRRLERPHALPRPAKANEPPLPLFSRRRA